MTRMSETERITTTLLCTLQERDAPKDTDRSVRRRVFWHAQFFLSEGDYFTPDQLAACLKCAVCMLVRVHTHAVSSNLPVVESSFVIVNQSVKAWRALNSGQADQRLLYDGWTDKLKDRKVVNTHVQFPTPMLHYFSPLSVFF